MYDVNSKSNEMKLPELYHHELLLSGLVSVDDHVPGQCEPSAIQVAFGTLMASKR